MAIYGAAEADKPAISLSNFDELKEKIKQDSTENVYHSGKWTYLFEEKILSVEIKILSKESCPVRLTFREISHCFFEDQLVEIGSPVDKEVQAVSISWVMELKCETESIILKTNLAKIQGAFNLAHQSKYQIKKSDLNGNEANIMSYWRIDHAQPISKKQVVIRA
jgi:hypothetical protein